MESIILDSGILTNLRHREHIPELDTLFQKMKHRKIHAYLTHDVILETTNHLSRYFTKIDVFSLIKSLLRELNLETIELTQDDYLNAGRLKYRFKYLSACDALLVIAAKKYQLQLHTTDGAMTEKMDENFRNTINVKIYRFLDRLK